MKHTKDEFQTLSDTHDEAKLLIDKMVEDYRHLQVFQINPVENKLLHLQTKMPLAP